MGEIVTRHQDAVYRYLCSLTSQTHQAEDAMQQAFLDAMRGAGTFTGAGSVRGWLLTLARNALFRGVRRRAGEPSAFVPLSELGVAAGWGADPDAVLQRAMDRRTLRRAVEQLSPASREVIVLRDLEGFSGRETADILAISLAAQKSRLHRARLELVAGLRRGGHDGP